MMDNFNPHYWIQMTAKDLETKYISRQAFDEVSAELKQAQEVIEGMLEAIKADKPMTAMVIAAGYIYPNQDVSAGAVEWASKQLDQQRRKDGL